MRTLLLDADGVLVDFLPHWLNYLNLFHGIDLKPEQVTKYALHETNAAKAFDKKLIYEPFKRPGFFATAPMMPGARDFIKKLQDLEMKALDNGGEQEFQFFIVTHPSGADSAKEKYEWVERAFGDDIKIIMTKHKYMIAGDILVDDCVENVHKFLEHRPRSLGLIPNTPYLSNELKRFNMAYQTPNCRVLSDPTGRSGDMVPFFRQVLDEVEDLLYT